MWSVWDYLFLLLLPSPFSSPFSSFSSSTEHMSRSQEVEVANTFLMKDIKDILWALITINYSLISANWALHIINTYLLKPHSHRSPALYHDSTASHVYVFPAGLRDQRILRILTEGTMLMCICCVTCMSVVWCVTWLCGVYHMTVWYVSHDCVMCITWLCDVYHMTVWCVSHDCVMCITWLCDVSHDCVMCHMTMWCVSHDCMMCITWLCDVYHMTVWCGHADMLPLTLSTLFCWRSVMGRWVRALTVMSYM